MAGPIDWITKRGSLRGLARWLFLVTLVAAPWLYGATTAWAIELICGSLGVVLVLWIVSHLVDRSWPVVPRPAAVISGVILLLGWWMTLNAHSIYDSGLRSFVPIPSFVSNAPGSRDYSLSVAMMLRATALIGTICLVAEMVQRRTWLARLWYALTFSGGSIALLGLAERGSGARMIFWQPLNPQSDFTTFFASYYYHGNAGAFFNLMLPPAAGLVIWMIARRSYLGRAICGATLLIIVLAIAANTSRMAQVIALLLVVAIVVTMLRRQTGFGSLPEGKTLAIGLAVVLVTVFAVASASRLEKPLGRWQNLAGQWRQDARWPASRTALSALGQVGALGFGPGTFRAVFPHFQKRVPDLHGQWRFLHEDYLQTLLEWGWLGSAALALLFFGGLAVGVRNYLRREDWSNRQRILLICCMIALGGVAIHALVDFPLQILSIQLLVATYLGICWGSVFWKEKG